MGSHSPKGSLNSSRPLRAFPREGTLSMSPLHYPLCYRPNRGDCSSAPVLNSETAPGARGSWFARTPPRESPGTMRSHWRDGRRRRRRAGQGRRARGWRSACCERRRAAGPGPALTLDNGEVLTENVTVLQYIADRNPAAKLAPAAGTMERYRLMEWLSFVNTEVHKSFTPLFREDAPAAAKEYARKNLATRFDYLQRALASKSFLMATQYTVADAYLFTVLS